MNKGGLFRDWVITTHKKYLEFMRNDKNDFLQLETVYYDSKIVSEDDENGV